MEGFILTKASFVAGGINEEVTMKYLQSFPLQATRCDTCNNAARKQKLHQGIIFFFHFFPPTTGSESVFQRDYKYSSVFETINTV